MAFLQKRIAPRIEAQFTGRMVLQTGQQQSVVTKNINAYGAYLLTDKCPTIGDRVTLFLEWLATIGPSEPAFEVSGAVLRTEKLAQETCGFAVKFEELPAWADE